MILRCTPPSIHLVNKTLIVSLLITIISIQKRHVKVDKMMSYVQEKKCFEDETMALVSCEISEQMIHSISFVNAKSLFANINKTR